MRKVTSTTMAPTTVDVEWQTSLIIKYLLEDDDDPACRRFDDQLEVDGPGGEDDGFDPVQIADKLRTIADSLNDSPKFKAAVTDLKKAAAQEALEAAFSQGVDAVCEAQVVQVAEVAPEMQLIKASVAFGLYVKKSTPELSGQIHSVMTSFLTRRVGPWLNQQGGWANVSGV